MKTVLVVDDDEGFRDLVRAILENDDCRVLAAADGTAGLEAATREHPDVIVLACRMRDLWGMELLQLLRADIRTIHTPVILMSGPSAEEIQQRGGRNLL